MASNIQLRATNVQYQPLRTSNTFLSGEHSNLPDRTNHTHTHTQSHLLLWLWRGMNTLVVIFFLVSAYVQINDPDPYIWIPVYVIPALLCGFLVWKPETSESQAWTVLCIVHIALCIMGVMYTLALVIEVMKSSPTYNPLYHEEGRELGGLAIIIAWLCVCKFSSFGRSTGGGCSGWVLLLLAGLLGVLPLLVWSLCFLEGTEHQLAHCHGMFPGMLGATGTSAKI